MSTGKQLFNCFKKLFPNPVRSSFSNYDLKKANTKTFTNVLQSYKTFNELYQACLISNLPKISRTPTGGIQQRNIKHLSGAWDLELNITAANIFKGATLYYMYDNYIFKVRCGAFGVKDSTMTGFKAFRHVQRACKKYNIDYNNYISEDGEKIKLEIKPPLIKAFILNKLIKHVNHIDINNAYPSMICKNHPELTPVFTDLRKKHKLIGDMAIGFGQSEFISYKWAGLAKEAVNGTVEYILNLSEKMQAANFEIVCFNTDGIYYRDKTNKNRLYTDEDEGEEIGQYRHDYINCDFFAYSDGQYYFIENGKINVRARGFYTYEYLKPRDEWDEFDFIIAISQSFAVIEWWDGYGFNVNQGQEDLNRAEKLRSKRQ